MLPERQPLFGFHSDAVPDETLLVSSISGNEAISRLYEFQLALVSTDHDLDLDQIRRAPACLTLLTGADSGGGFSAEELPFHGVLTRFEMLDSGPDWANYRATLVPRLALLDLTTRSQVFLDQTVVEIVEQVLKDNGLTKDDYEFRLKGSYPKQEYTVQYQETDLNFVSRQLEHSGLFFFWDQSDNKDKLILSNDSSAAPPIPGGATLNYRPSSGLAAFDDQGTPLHEEAIQSLVCRQNALPAQVILRDYNYRKPSLELKAEAPVDTKSKGTVYEYGCHFKDNSEGKELAQVRSEEIKCREVVLSCHSDCRGIRAGHSFELQEHPRSGFNQTYLVTAVFHKGAQPLALAPGLADSQTQYSNEFEAIPGKIPFRPARITPKPTISGTINATIDASGSGEYAEIDDQGRYKVVIPFDLSGRRDGKASRFIRMAQPYAGADMGMHFPLHKGTEVILIHTNGDPDRPIIAAAVPNPETGSPVTGPNQTQCQVKTGGGNHLVIEDTAGNQRINLSTPYAGTYVQLGAQEREGEGVVVGTDADSRFLTARDYIRRTGANVKIETQGNEFKITRGNKAEETHGNSRTWVQGNSQSEVIGDSISQVTGNSTSTVVGNTSETFTGNKSSTHVGGVSEKFAGTKQSYMAAGTIEMKAAAASSTTVGIAHETFVGGKLEANLSGILKISKSKEINLIDVFKQKVAGPMSMEGATVKIDAVTSMTVEAGTSLTIKCGGSEIKLTPAEVTIKSPKITIQTTGALSMKAGGTVDIKGTKVSASPMVEQG